ncbi:DUF1254 domain-containing protein [Sinorhizobium meliloti]|uniref:DUF1254 domain-containing protein n=1 Tax=Rhizobium meliloti TaxID=382 RepID=UPI000FDA6E08|nr:DUF1254 domain-containing protein [Sinorhizobium meliloti]MDW9856795.1 DUF1254 domain-containing protein [Sinorhizobium meliloti]MDW9875389.1 DUF1254 domain-containing protein [Sinorhizobium meliloti]MDW9887543.1 DUF1254 domain-containing protein [Sinorhizobium meliloti]MDX0209772.1 DUF1254 domain-containing protein [Sinorhizobium meliloti]
MIAGPQWKGEVPKGISRSFRRRRSSSTSCGRTQLFNPDNLDNVKRIQAGNKLQSLSEYEGKSRLAEPKTDWVAPISAAQQKTNPQFYNVLSFLRFCCSLRRPTVRDCRVRSLRNARTESRRPVRRGGTPAGDTGCARRWDEGGTRRESTIVVRRYRYSATTLVGRRNRIGCLRPPESPPVKVAN